MNRKCIYIHRQLKIMHTKVNLKQMYTEANIKSIELILDICKLVCMMFIVKGFWQHNFCEF